VWLPGVLAALLAAAAACSQQPTPREESFAALGTAVSLKVAEGEESNLKLAGHLTRTMMRRVSELVDPYDPNSEVAKINRVAVSMRTPVSSDLQRLLMLALDYGERSKGALDITVEPLLQLWGFGGSPLPEKELSPELLKTALEGIGNRQVELHDDGTLEFKSPLTRLSLASIAKGYAVDLSIIGMRERGVQNVLLNLGARTLRCLGTDSRGEPWRVPIQNPSRLSEELGKVRIQAGRGFALSRLYENYVTIDGKRYGHVVDPRTGRPAEGVLCAAVLAPTATEADALSTALIALGLQESRPVLALFPRCEALLIPDTPDLQIWVTPGFASEFEPAPAIQSAIRAFSITG